MRVRSTATPACVRLIEATSSISLTRVHPNWLVNLKHVRELERIDGGTVLAAACAIYHR
jgi:DNA-binding LytR/AlgR family response regulator